MPYEAFANALARVTDDYADTQQEQRKFDRARAEEERRYQRDRKDRVADRDNERAYQEKRDKDRDEAQLRMARELTKISFEDWKTKREEEKLAAARALGIDNPESLSPSALFAQTQNAADAILTRQTKTKVTAEYEAREAVADKQRNDPEFAAKAAKDSENERTRNASQIAAAQADLANAQTELNQILKSAPGLGEIQTVQSAAESEAQRFLSSGVSGQQILASMPPLVRVKTPAQAQEYIRTNAVEWAKMRGVTEDSVKAHNAAVMANLKASSYAEHPVVAALAQRINNNVSFLTKLGVRSEGGAKSFFSPNTTSEVVSAVPATAVRLPGAAGTAAPETNPIKAAPGGVGFWSGTATPAASPASTAPAPTPADTVQRSALGVPTIFEWPNMLRKATGAPLTPPARVTGPSMFQASLQPPGLPDVTQASTTPDPASEAKTWLRVNGLVLPPDLEQSMISEYQTVVSSPIPTEEKAVRIQALQSRARGASARPSGGFWAPRN